MIHVSSAQHHQQLVNDAQAWLVAYERSDGAAQIANAIRLRGPPDLPRQSSGSVSGSRRQSSSRSSVADFQVSGRNVDIAFQFGTEQVAVLRDDAEWRLNSWFSRDDSRAGRELARRTRRALENDVPVEVMQGNAIGAR